MAKFASVSAPVLTLLRYSRKLWVRVALMALLALVASISAMLFEEHIPQSLRDRFSPEAVMPVLTILASGMLAVSTFSLNVMVSAHQAAASQATPRAHRILLADTTTHTVLATFIGAFVYALSAIILLQAGLHAPGSSVTVLAVTVLVVVLVILAILRWIDHLSDLGSMDATLRATGAEARPSLMQSRKAPALLASPLTQDTVIPTDAQPVRARRSGYLQVIRMPKINEALSDPAGRVWLHTPPGSSVLEGQIVGYASGLDDAQIGKVQAGLTIGETRTFEQDAAYGLLVFSEIASRALSPGINDPGTAVDVIARQERLLWQWATNPLSDEPPRYPQIFVPDLKASTLVKSAFAAIARDGSAQIEVVQRLLQALTALQDGPDADLADAARKMEQTVRDHARDQLTLQTDLAALAPD